MTAKPDRKNVRLWAGGQGVRRLLLGFVGLGLVVYLVHSAGPERVVRVLWAARPFLPILILLEFCQAASDYATLRVLIGRGVARRAWVRSSALAYAFMILVPAGRAAGEVARATILSRQIGAARAATAAIELQSAYVFAIGLLSAVECLVVGARLGLRSLLAILLAINAVGMLAFAGGLLLVARHARIGGWLERLLRRLSHTLESPSDGEVPQGRRRRRAVPLRAAAICLASRTAQVVEYGVILHAVGGRSGPASALVVHGIQMVAATVGDIFPNGLGIVDGMYRTFAAEIGFAGAPARALSIAFIAHLTQLIVATGALALLAVVRGEGPPAAPSVSGAGSSAPAA